MPRLDGMGPEGKGPLTGRKMGNCESNVKNNVNNANKTNFANNLNNNVNKPPMRGNNRPMRGNRRNMGS